MRMLRHVTLVLAMLAGASPAWAQAPVTAADLTQLETTANDIEQRAANVKKTNPTLGAAAEKDLADLRDEISFLKVKLRRSAPVTRAEYNDLRDRLAALRTRVSGGPDRSPVAAPAAARPTPPRANTPPPVKQGGMLEWADKGFINVGPGGQFGHQTINTGFSFPLYEETAIISTSRGVEGGVFFDVTAGFRITGNMGVGVNFYSRSATGPGVYTSSIPDPISFDSDRRVNGSIAKLTHNELQIAPLFVYVWPVSEKMDLMVLAGPTVVRLKHDLVDAATVTESASGPTINITVNPISRSFIGYQVGADLRYMLTNRLGVGGFLRFGRATANLSNNVKLKLGGPQLGLGARIRF